MAREFALCVDGVLNSADLGLLSPKAFVVWIYAVRWAAEGNSDYPDWDAVAKSTRHRKATIHTIRNSLIKNGLVSGSPPYALLRRGELWKICPDRPPFPEWSETRLRIFERDNYTCQYCGQRGGKLECDHIIPVAKDGGHHDANLATACFACNRSKRDKTLEEWTANRGAHTHDQAGVSTVRKHGAGVP